MSSQTPRQQKLQAKLRELWQPSTASKTIGAIPQPGFYEQGSIVSVDATTPATVTLTLGGSTTQLSGVRYNATLTPTVGMTVWCVRTGNDLFVLCTLAS